MGAYLSEPITSKESEDGEGQGLRFGASCMQGWRVSQEDAHNCIGDFDNGTSLFGVYDGHGGAEVAIYLSRHLPEFLKKIEEYKNGNDMKKALHSAFVEIDEAIKSKEVQEEIQAIAKSKCGDSKDESVNYDEEENVGALYEEATMPLENLIAKYHSDADLTVPQAETNEKPCSSKSLVSPKRSAAEQEGTDGASGASSSAEEVKVNEVNESECEKKPNVDVIDGPQETNTEIEGKINEKVEILVENSTDPVSNTNGVIKINDEEGTQEISVGINDKKLSQKLEINENGHTLSEEAAKIEVTHSKPNANDMSVNKTVADTEISHVNGESKDKETDSMCVEDSSKKPDTFERLSKKRLASSPDIQRLRMVSIYQRLIKEPDSSDSEEDDDSFHISKNPFENEDTSDSNEEVDNSDTSDEEVDDDDLGEEEESEDEENEFLTEMQEPGFDSGSTAVVALTKWELDLLHLWVANAGDSRCVISRNGKAVDMSKDHKPEEDGETSRIVRAGGKVTADGRVNGGLNLSRALGDHSYKQNDTLPLEEQMITPVPDVEHIVLDPATDNFIVLACDGIWNSMSSQEVVDFVSQRLKTDTDIKLSSVCEQLFDNCLARDTSGDGTGCDNMTAVIICFQKSKNGGKRSLSFIEEEEEKDEPKRLKLQNETDELLLASAD